jgi:uncharacterized YkwD family protein
VSIPSIDDVKTLEQQVIDLVNKQRAANGLGMLKSNWELCRVARYKSQDMINKGYFSHTSPTYGSPFNMMENFGIRFSAAGENIAYGQRTPQEVMNSWMNSHGHRANILSPSYNQIGVGVAKKSNGTYTGRRCLSSPCTKGGGPGLAFGRPEKRILRTDKPVRRIFLIINNRVFIVNYSIQNDRVRRAGVFTLKRIRILCKCM